MVADICEVRDFSSGTGAVLAAISVMRVAVTLAAVLAVTTGTASADGFYYGQSYGISSARADGSSMIGASLHLRIQLGWRWGSLSVGPWFAGHLAADRDNSLYGGLLGGDPPPGDSDFKNIGVDARYNATVHENISIYVRGGPRVADAVGALDGYRGFGFGAGTGVQFTGKVRALGFLFAPLFFMKKGPLINACIYFDQNVDFYRLYNDTMPTLNVPVVGTSIGLGAGSYF